MKVKELIAKAKPGQRSIATTGRRFRLYRSLDSERIGNLGHPFCKYNRRGGD